MHINVGPREVRPSLSPIRVLPTSVPHKNYVYEDKPTSAILKIFARILFVAEQEHPHPIAVVDFPD